MTTSGLSKTSTGKLVSNELVIDIDMDTAIESDRSPEDSMQDIDKFSMIWWIFMSSTLVASVFMGKNYSDNLHSIKNTGNNLPMKQMFDISEKFLVEQSDEIFGVSQISWESSQWKQLLFG